MFKLLVILFLLKLFVRKDIFKLLLYFDAPDLFLITEVFFKISKNFWKHAFFDTTFMFLQVVYIN